MAPKPINLDDFAVVKFCNPDIERNYINDVLHALAAHYKQLAAGQASIGNKWGSITGTLSDQTDLQAALVAKADLSGATFTGAVDIAALTSTTQSPGDNSTKAATTAYVDAAVSGGSIAAIRRISALRAY